MASLASVGIPFEQMRSTGTVDMPSIEPRSNIEPIFSLSSEDIELLEQSEGFQILRHYLAEHYHHDFCADHTTSHADIENTWLLLRDVLHALLVPIVELFDKAASVAEQATNATRIEDLEYAYHSDARGSFLWLQCFLDRERDWCLTHGCPACVVERALDSEFSIRLLYAACLLSDIHYPFTLEGPTLPSFMFILDPLRLALEKDSLWGISFFESMDLKAIQLRNGVEELIHQSLSVDALLNAALLPADEHSTHASPQVSPILAPVGGAPAMKIKRSKLAKRQRKLEIEESMWLQEMLKKTWSDAQLGTDGVVSLVSGLALDDQLKTEPLVAVRELPPDDL